MKKSNQQNLEKFQKQTLTKKEMTKVVGGTGGVTSSQVRAGQMFGD